MQTNEATAVDNETTGSDLGPLAWVLDELKKSLDGASKAMRRFAAEGPIATEARNGDVAKIMHFAQQFARAFEFGEDRRLILPRINAAV